MRHGHPAGPAVARPLGQDPTRGRHLWRKGLLRTEPGTAKRLEVRLLTKMPLESPIGSGAMTGEPTVEQRAAIDAPVDAGTLVLAGPGTGKTYTLILRLDRMLAET